MSIQGEINRIKNNVADAYSVVSEMGGNAPSNPNTANLAESIASIPTGIPGPAAGFGTPTATIDANTGTPSVAVSATGPDTAKVFNFAFKNLKGAQGLNGAAAGFGTPTATIDANTGTPSVTVSMSGPDTAKVFNFAFKNLKGATGAQGPQGDTVMSVGAPNAGAHNSIYRGNSLGSGVKTYEWTAIESGTFDGLYIGDYWTISGINYRIAAFDYFPDIAEHHVVIVPDSGLYEAEMNSSNTTAGGYVGSNMYTTKLAQAKTTIKAAFSGHVLSHQVYLTNAVTNGVPSAGASYDREVELMNEQMTCGGAILMPLSNGTTVPTNYRIEKSQLPLFAHRPDLITSSTSYWLRDVVDSKRFSCINSNGNILALNATSSYGVRPYFCVA